MLLVISFAIIAGIYFWFRSRRKQNLSIFLTDYYMRIDEPIPIHGTPDIVWIDKDGLLIVGDYKSRTSCKVHDSDIIQLSVYKVLLERTQCRPVSNIGYVHFKNSRACVKLLDEKTIVALYDQYQKIVSGKIKAKRTNKSGYCQHCSYLKIC